MAVRPAQDLSQSPPAGLRRPQSMAGRRWSAVLLLLTIVALALGPRWLARDVFMTSDEDSWMRRAGGFAWGVANGRLGRTYQNGHPGVLTMELAILGQGPGGAERFADPVTDARLVTRVPGFFDGLVEARRAFAVAGALLVGLTTLLAWRVFGLGPALAGGVLLALDPWLIAHAQLVHTDGLLAGLTAAAALCALARWGRSGARWYLVLGGILSGLAFLVKVPAVYLVLAIPLLGLVLAGRRPRLLLTDLAVWGLAGAVTVVGLWPSLWVNLDGTIQRMVEFTRDTGGQPDEVGSFFLGQVWGDPGLLFYPVALGFRLTPATTIGILALLVLGWQMRRLLAGRWTLVLVLVAYALGFLAFISIGQKKFDRYALPFWPVLLLLAGLGWWLLYRRIRPFLPLGSPFSAAVAGTLALIWLQGSAPASVYPYYMAYFNPLLGGGPAAERTVMIGNGEGMDQVAAYLNALPDADDIWVASHSYDLLAASCRCSGEPLRERPPGDAHYLVVYGRRIQLRRWGPSLEQYLEAREPVQRVWINGIEMARIYRGPRLENERSG